MLEIYIKDDDGKIRELPRVSQTPSTILLINLILGGLVNNAGKENQAYWNALVRDVDGISYHHLRETTPSNKQEILETYTRPK